MNAGARCLRRRSAIYTARRVGKEAPVRIASGAPSTAVGSYRVDCRLRPGGHPIAKQRSGPQANRIGNPTPASRTWSTMRSPCASRLTRRPPGLGVAGDTARPLWCALVEGGGYSTIHRFGQVRVAEVVEGVRPGLRPLAGVAFLMEPPGVRLDTGSRPCRKAITQVRASRRLLCDHSTWPSLVRPRCSPLWPSGAWLAALHRPPRSKLNWLRVSLPTRLF